MRILSCNHTHIFRNDVSLLEVNLSKKLVTFSSFRSRNGLLEGIFRKMVDEIRPKGWTKQLGKYTGELRICLSHLKTMSGEEIGGAVNRWEREKWRVRSHCSSIEIR